jgi:hypothetical protein
MNDEYLWDRSGEPDPEVQRLEQVLDKYRYQAKPLSPGVSYRTSERRIGWIRFAAVAAVILIVFAALWILKAQKAAPTGAPGVADNAHQPDKRPDEASPKKEPEHVPAVAIAATPSHKVRHNSSEGRLAESFPGGDPFLSAQRQPIINPFIDVETARHIERAQLLLRSFRNTRESEPRLNDDVSYERQGSRDLLYKNILLRRDAEAKGNMPVEELLGSLEPFLLDIANLPDKPSGNDVRSIKERMQKKEIVSALQIYSAPTLSQVF